MTLPKRDFCMPNASNRSTRTRCGNAWRRALDATLRSLPLLPRSLPRLRLRHRRDNRRARELKHTSKTHTAYVKRRVRCSQSNPLGVENRCRFGPPPPHLLPPPLRRPTREGRNVGTGTKTRNTLNCRRERYRAVFPSSVFPAALLY